MGDEGGPQSLGKEAGWSLETTTLLSLSLSFSDTQKEVDMLKPFLTWRPPVAILGVSWAKGILDVGLSQFPQSEMH